MEGRVLKCVQVGEATLILKGKLKPVKLILFSDFLLIAEWGIDRWTFLVSVAVNNSMLR